MIRPFKEVDQGEQTTNKTNNRKTEAMTTSKNMIIVSVNSSNIKVGFKVFNVRKDGYVAHLTSVFSKSRYSGSAHNASPLKGQPVFGFATKESAIEWAQTCLRSRPDLQVWEVQYTPVNSVIMPLCVRPDACRKAGLKVRAVKADLWAKVNESRSKAVAELVKKGVVGPAPFGTVLMASVRPLRKVFSI